MTATIMTRLDSFRRDPDGRIVNATDPWFLTEAEIAGRRQALEYVRFLRDRVPGYEHASLVALGTRIGVRETRRVYGDARLTRDDVLRGAAVRRRDRPVRRADRGPPRRRRHDLAVPARRRGGRASPTGRSSSATRPTCWSRAAASRRPMTPMPRSDRWPSAWPWARRPGRRRRMAVATGAGSARHRRGAACATGCARTARSSTSTAPAGRAG